MSACAINKASRAGRIGARAHCPSRTRARACRHAGPLICGVGILDREGVLEMKSCLLVATLSLMLLSASVQATSLCRWVDESGRTQIAEVVPERYRKVAVCTDSQKYELSAEQRRAAEQRVADDKERARVAAAKPPSDRASSARGPARAASKPGAKQPTEIVTADTDCATWWRIYDESVECFGPFRTTRGATKPEGFDRCNVVASPESRCGPRSN